MRPAPGEFTEAVYAHLPAYLRNADPVGDLWAALRLTWAVYGEADEVDDWADRIDGDPLDPAASSVLADPAAAPPGFLEWIAQWTPVPDALAGTSVAGTLAQLDADFATLGDIDAAYADLGAVAQHGLLVGDPVRTVEDLRASLLAFLDTGWYPGSRRWLRSLIQPYLTGGRSVRFAAHHGGDPWVLRVTTYPGETPHPGVVAALLAINADLLPAGLEVIYDVEGATLGELDADFATLGDIDAAFATLAAITEYVP